MIDVAREAHHGQCTDEGALLLLQNLAPCLEELLDYRRRALASLELVPDIMPANVIRMDPRP